MKIRLRESGQKLVTDGRLQDFVNEAIQIEILRNFEQIDAYKTTNSKQIKLQRATIYTISVQNKLTQVLPEDLHQPSDDSYSFRELKLGTSVRPGEH